MAEPTCHHDANLARHTGYQDGHHVHLCCACFNASTSTPREWHPGCLEARHDRR